MATLDMMPAQASSSSATANPWSRLGNSTQHKTMAETQAWIKSRLLTVDPYRAQMVADKKAGEAAGKLHSAVAGMGWLRLAGSLNL